ncbi:MAG TPA: hypothetical protein VIX41_04720, partial [Acidimicrobiales bacterium]
MTDPTTDRPPSQPGRETGPPVRPRPPDAHRRFRRRYLLVAVALVVAWLVVAALVGAATSDW